MIVRMVGVVWIIWIRWMFKEGEKIVRMVVQISREMKV